MDSRERRELDEAAHKLMADAGYFLRRAAEEDGDSALESLRVARARIDNASRLVSHEISRLELA